MELSFEARAMKNGSDLKSVVGTGNIEDAVWACNDLAKRFFGAKAMIVLVINGKACARIKVNDQSFTGDVLAGIYSKCIKLRGYYVVEHRGLGNA